MRHYHGTPLGGTRDSVAKFCAAQPRHFLVPWKRCEDLPIVSSHCAGFCLDNSAFSAWKAGAPIADWSPYMDWVRSWCQHPSFDFAIIPDVIDGSEKDNDRLIRDWVQWDGWTVNDSGSEYEHIAACTVGVPVWHLHESLERLDRLTRGWYRVALGSSGDFATIGTDRWDRRMAEAFGVICDSDGRPRCKVHGLRMLARDIVEAYPFSSCDSTNVAQNSQLVRRYGQYCPPTQAQRREVLAARIECGMPPAVWVGREECLPLFDKMSDVPE